MLMSHMKSNYWLHSPKSHLHEMFPKKGFLYYLRFVISLWLEIKQQIYSGGAKHFYYSILKSPIHTTKYIVFKSLTLDMNCDIFHKKINYLIDKQIVHCYSTYDTQEENSFKSNDYLYKIKHFLKYIKILLSWWWLNKL